ncbi:energy-coupling factor transporter transmembrane component T family protein [Halorhodospira halophila]|uniref:Cobalt transport protein n=1 Tax=Halorhodospira halophila (strain DSM 244 / SL1) TaxID=349124 RepID=A1WU12_HALHL|nr:energy-coupling factor transporter transmembrane component T [Halorhodospira halophila]ABM61174.1 cobalt transport protein [Halorhodospira halophila SL1]MBK1729633.1 energy-coupling factor transporter transmembrane protein EcfT [Halorhodospira halophila]
MPVSSITDAPEGRQTPLHRVSMRTKMLISVAAAVTVIVLESPGVLLSLFAVSAAYAALTRRYGILIGAYLLFAILWLMAMGFMQLMGLVLPRLGYGDIADVIVPFLRSAILLNTVLAMALSSRVQGALSALKSLYLPYWLYLPAVSMVRFVPAFLFDIRQVGESVRLKGYKPGPFLLLRHPIASLRLIFMPLLFRALRTADDLAVAAELKGLGGGTQASRYRADRLRSSDWAFLVMAALVVAGSLWLEQGAGWS